MVHSGLRILAIFLMINVAVATVAPPEIDDEKTLICLRSCGADILTCSVQCTIKEFLHIIQCITGCCTTNFECMDECVKTAPSPPPKHRSPPDFQIP
ncbi:hypothetical protein M5689_021186 [Euphorbia peplus]|nr:hypothetical protein M5689_021186 [Euphorbia peplus]